MIYTSQHVTTLFNVSQSTIRNWTIEFAQYLSPSAAPPKGKNRYYTLEDMEVLSLVAELKRQGVTYEEIHAALKSGQRGEVTPLPPQEVQVITATEGQRRLSHEVEQLQQMIVKLRTELHEAQTKAEAVDEVKLENMRLKTSLGYAERDRIEARQQTQQTQEKLDQMTKRVEELSRQLGEEYARGIIETLERRGELSRKESKE